MDSRVVGGGAVRFEGLQGVVRVVRWVALCGLKQVREQLERNGVSVVVCTFCRFAEWMGRGTDYEIRQVGHL